MSKKEETKGKYKVGKEPGSVKGWDIKASFFMLHSRNKVENSDYDCKCDAHSLSLIN